MQKKWIFLMGIGSLFSCQNTVPGTEPGKKPIPETPPKPDNPAPKNVPVPPSPGDSKIDGPAAFADFSFPEPTSNANSLKLWATFYFVPKISSSPNGEVVVREKSENNLLGMEKISKKEWCELALEGSGRIFPSGAESFTVSFKDRSTSNPIFCDGFIGSKSIIAKVKGNRFEKTGAVFGRGARVKEVIPYRTIAVDSRVIPYGSVVFIPEARGKQVELASGKMVTHDGYFFAGDTGSAILGNHIDVFTGMKKKQPFEFVKSSAGSTFEAKLITDQNIFAALKAMHGYGE